MKTKRTHTDGDGRLWADARTVRYMVSGLFTVTGIKPQKGGWP